MMFPSPFFRDCKKTANAVRWFAGVSITGTCQRIESALIGIYGRGSGAPVEIRKTISFDIPRDITDSFDALQQYCTAAKDASAKIPVWPVRHVAKELAAIEEEAVQELINESRLPANNLLAIGIHDPGLRVCTNEGVFYQGLCDAAFLAEQTGINIVDSFFLQDIAVRGNGGPLFPLPAWIYLKSETSSRILIDLGRTARLTFMPKPENAFSFQKIQHKEVVPCGSLLDMLVWQLTGGKTAVDTGGKIAVQGCQNQQLLNQLRTALSNEEKWSPTGLKPERYLLIADQAMHKDLPHQDVLCTVSCFIAETIAEQVKQYIQPGQPEPEILIQGSGCRHGLLMNSLTTQLQKRNLMPTTQWGIPVDTFDALCTAMLTSLTIDHIPGNLPHITGGETAKTLGRITPGTMANWHRLLCEMAETKPANRSLRSAV